MNIQLKRRVCDGSGESRGLDQLGLAAIPLFKNLCRGSTTQDAGVDQSGELDTWNVPGCAVNALEVPNGLCPVKVLADGYLSALD